MSQYWHAHWANESFRPERLQNWEVPKWHPCWPDKHCRPTVFQANNHGHILAGRKKAPYSPCGGFKDTWALPKRITRQVANELSSAPGRKRRHAWMIHKAANEAACKGYDNALGRERVAVSAEDPVHGLRKQLETDIEVETSFPVMHIVEEAQERPCLLHHTRRV